MLPAALLTLCLAAVPAVPAVSAVPAVPRTITVAPGETVAVHETGTGAPVVIVPGLLGGAFSWRKVAPLLAAKGRRVVIVEPLGIGDSGRPETADYSLTAQARRVAAALDTLGIRKAAVAGHVLGAAIVFRLAVARPDLVGTLYALDGGANEAAGTPGLARGLKLGGMVARFGGGELIRARLRQELKENSVSDKWITREVVDRYAGGRAADVAGSLAVFRRIAASTEPEPIGPRLPALRLPVRIVLGAEEHTGGINEGEIRHLEAQLADVTVVRVPQGGLWLQEEQPAALAEILGRT